jgi:hypothetical protein
VLVSLVGNNPSGTVKGRRHVAILAETGRAMTAGTRPRNIVVATEGAQRMVAGRAH